ncbi:hypothetical protein D7V93_10645 [Corallococcus llansteffanensis]|uniref:Uncharacterized protein n=1 Tax=Corallococcus llansteffanensis TaxID=2316731 RepID=A0A3A8Q0F4_9BACT|nr:hypothetical protein D7V93_10645 [Corallococcus llansteffanensis]
MLHRARQVLVAMSVLSVAVGPVWSFRGFTRGEPLLLRRAPGAVDVASRPVAVPVGMPLQPAAVAHHRVQHGGDREPVHQDHQSQAGQVASVSGVPHGGSFANGVQDCEGG